MGALRYPWPIEVLVTLNTLRDMVFLPLLLLALLGACSSGAGDDDDSVGANDDDSGADNSDEDCLTHTITQGIDLVQVCAGTFEMGCTPEQSNCDPDESPVHEVTLTRAFWLGQTEVTQSQWQALMAGTPSFHASCGVDCPVEMVTWYEALLFTNAVSAAEGLDECYTLDDCASAPGQGTDCGSVTVNSPTGRPYDCSGYRLPTEAEWEYAARADSTTLYAGSDSIDDVGWYVDNSDGTTHPVGAKAPNAFGFLDMSGNVWEWLGDRYDASYYTGDAQTDPVGPDSGDYRAYRGGAWYAPADFTRVARRNHDHPENRGHGLGLRLARTVQ